MTNGAVIARCSQPEVGWFGWRSQEDENLLHALGTACAMDSVSASLKKQLHKHYHKNVHMDTILNGDVIHDGSDIDDKIKEASSESGALEQRKVLVVDARSYSAAVVNRAKGGGCECEGKLVRVSLNITFDSIWRFSESYYPIVYYQCDGQNYDVFGMNSSSSAALET